MQRYHRLPVLIMAVVSLTLIGWRWPVPTPQPTATFGQPDRGGLHTGIRLAGGAQPAYPVDEGEVVFVFRGDAASPRRGAAPATLGTALVAEHARGFRSVYAHLDPASVPIGSTAVFPDVPLGLAGDSGLTMNRGLLFTIIDARGSALVNPLLLLPGLDDPVPPSIDEIRLVSDGRSRQIRTGVEVEPGTYELHTLVADRFWWNQSPPIMPYAVAAYLNGETVAEQQMDRFAGTAGGDRPVFDHDGLLVLGRVTIGAGRNDLEVVVRDFAGTERVVRVELRGVARR